MTLIHSIAQSPCKHAIKWVEAVWRGLEASPRRRLAAFLANVYRRRDSAALIQAMLCTPARMIRISIIVSLAVALFLFQAGAMADRHYVETVRTEPAYNETTKSYFQYIEYSVAQGGVSWSEANQLAARQSFKGTRGRLAVIRSPETNNFLRRIYKTQHAAWIGLRYFCSFRELLWVTGEVAKRQDFKNWDSRWYRNESVTCDAQRGTIQYMPVYYTESQNGFRWQASGPQKKFYGYFVEYVTDKK